MTTAVLESTHKVLFKGKKIRILFGAFENGTSEVTSTRKSSVH